jgi:hypothetical protein
MRPALMRPALMRLALMRLALMRLALMRLALMRPAPMRPALAWARSNGSPRDSTTTRTRYSARTPVRAE